MSSDQLRVALPKKIKALTTLIQTNEVMLKAHLKSLQTEPTVHKITKDGA